MSYSSPYQMLSHLTICSNFVDNFLYNITEFLHNWCFADGSKNISNKAIVKTGFIADSW